MSPPSFGYTVLGFGSGGVPAPEVIYYVVVAGGAGGGGEMGGGGGAGGYRSAWNDELSGADGDNTNETAAETELSITPGGA